MASRRRPRPVESAEHGVLFQQGTNTNKRRRAAAAAAADDPPGPWSSMHGDLVRLIAERVLAGDLLDYVRFRAACRHWRSCTADPRGRGVADRRFHPRRWMMLPEGHGLHPGHRRLRGRARFFNLDTGAFVCARVPELEDHCVLDFPDGLLLLRRDADAAIRLLHPFTGDIVGLPPLKSLLPQPQRNPPCFLRVTAAAVSVAAQATTGTAVVTVLLALEHFCRFAHASTADRSWTLASWTCRGNLSRALPFHGSFFHIATCDDGSEDFSILRLDAPLLDDGRSSSSSSLPPPQTIAKFPAKQMILPWLVECDSEILVVGSTDVYSSHLVVIRLADLLASGSGTTACHPTPLTSIGDHCLFFGQRSFAVSSKGLPSVAGNSIVLCSTIKNGPVQYQLSDGTISPPCDGDIARTPPPSPHSIIHHLLTCCYRYFWNKGLMYCPRTEPSWKTKRKLRFGA